jgi:hypothetical protein
METGAGVGEAGGSGGTGAGAQAPSRKMSVRSGNCFISKEMDYPVK